MLTSPCMFQICSVSLQDIMVCMWVCVGVVRSMFYLCGSVEDEGMVTDSPHTGLLLSARRRTLLTTTPGMASTSGHTAISTRDQQGKGRADWDFGALAWVHFIRANIHSVDLSPILNSQRHVISSDVKTNVLFLTQKHHTNTESHIQPAVESP